jgi:tetratricopeptide (TPR) repeat protein
MFGGEEPKLEFPFGLESGARQRGDTGRLRILGRFFYVLAFFALVYALLAGLRTAQDFDLGWQMATGRWVVQHHSVPSVDVLSYTVEGAPWIYPVGSGSFFYAAFLLGGYALISWIGAAACCGTVALLLRRGPAASAAIAMLAVPLIAYRTTPRADMFTVVLFAAFLSLLWENYQTGHAPLCLLPLLMLVWVNVHFGFAAGLVLLLVYVGLELLETVRGEERRRTAWHRLRQASGWLVCTALVTLANPWGWGLYRALMRQERAAAQQQYWIAEWTPVRLSWSAFSSALALRDTKGALYLMLAIAVIAGIVALLRAQWGAAILLLGAIYPAMNSIRMAAIFSCVVVVVGGFVLQEAVVGFRSRIRPPRIRWFVAGAAVAMLSALAVLRSFDLASNRNYFLDNSGANFGAGLSWWFPRRAAEFIDREKLPREIFNTYPEGGYLAWKLGPERRVYIDGRDTLFGVSRIQRQSQLLQSPSDSALWEQETRRYNVNTVILPLGGYNKPILDRLQDFCNSKVWRPVYFDEVSAVFVRRVPQTEQVIQRFPVDCATAPLPAEAPGANRVKAFSSWANAALVLAALGRNEEALAATEKAIAISDNPLLRWNRAEVLFAMGRLDAAEQDYRAAIALDPSAFTWASLANSYLKRGRIPAAIEAMKRTAELSQRPFLTLADLGDVYLQTGHPGDALLAYDEAVQKAPKDIDVSDGGSFHFHIAQGRSSAWGALGNLTLATSYEEEAVQALPEAPQPLQRLAQLYDRQGRLEDANRARERAAKLAPSHD